MTIALVATADNDLAAVLLQVTGAAAGAVTITRVDANGTGTVRLMDGQQPIAGVLTVRDYEVALQGTATYTVLDSASGTASATADMAVEFPVIMAAVLPNARQQFVAVMDYDAAQEYAGTVHWVIGRDDPLVVTSPMRLREGSVTMWAGSYEDAKAIADVTRSGEVLMFRQPTFAGMDKYLIARRVSVSPQSQDTSPRRWEVVLDYTEVKVPSGVLLAAAGWNYAAAKDSFDTYADFKVAFATYADAVVGP
ncbi:hypothetical protein ACWEOW_11245 [Monashia sp. NPDC004114]